MALVAELTAASPRIESRGSAHELFTHLFERPFGPAEVAAFTYRALPTLEARERLRSLNQKNRGGRFRRPRTCLRHRGGGDDRRRSACSVGANGKPSGRQSSQRPDSKAQPGERLALRRGAGFGDRWRDVVARTHGHQFNGSSEHVRHRRHVCDDLVIASVRLVRTVEVLTGREVELRPFTKCPGRRRAGASLGGKAVRAVRIGEPATSVRPRTLAASARSNGGNLMGVGLGAALNAADVLVKA